MTRYATTVTLCGTVRLCSLSFPVRVQIEMAATEFRDPIARRIAALERVSALLHRTLSITEVARASVVWDADVDSITGSMVESDGP